MAEVAEGRTRLAEAAAVVGAVPAALDARKRLSTLGVVGRTTVRRLPSTRTLTCSPTTTSC